MVETSGHDAVGPQPLGSQFVHFSAGGDGVAAGHHPVVGRRGDDDANPTHEARDEAHHLQASGYHGAHSDARAAGPSRTVSPCALLDRAGPGLALRGPGSGALEVEGERLRASVQRGQVRLAGTAALLGSAPPPPL